MLFFVLLFFLFATNGQPLLQVRRPSPTFHFVSDGCESPVEESTELNALSNSAATIFPLCEVDNSGCLSSKWELTFEANVYKVASSSLSWSFSEVAAVLDCSELLIMSITFALVYFASTLVFPFQSLNYDFCWLLLVPPRNLLKRDSHYIYLEVQLRLVKVCLWKLSKELTFTGFYSKISDSKLSDSSSISNNSIIVGRIHVWQYYNCLIPWAFLCLIRTFDGHASLGNTSWSQNFH